MVEDTRVVIVEGVAEVVATATTVTTIREMAIATKRIMVREARHGQEEEEDMAVATAMEAREVL